MDAFIPYEDPAHAATARSCALRWLLAEDVLDAGAVAHQFGISSEAIQAVRDGAPLLVSDARAIQIDRMVATQSLLLEGYSPDRMTAWFKTPLPTLHDRSAVELLSGSDDATATVLEAAEAWMA